MPPRHRDEPIQAVTDKIESVIARVEDDIFDKLEQTGFKAQARIVEKQLETEDTMIETILRLIIQFAEDRKFEQGNNAAATRENLENVSAAEITFLIQTLEDLRQPNSSVHTNRNKFANAFAFLLASEV